MKAKIPFTPANKTMLTYYNDFKMSCNMTWSTQIPKKSYFFPNNCSMSYLQDTWPLTHMSIEY